MKKKRVLATMLVAAVAATTLAACNNNSGNADNGVELKEATTPDTYPIQTDVTLRWWMGLPNQVTAYGAGMNDTYVDDYLKEFTGIGVSYEHPVAGQEAAAFNIMQSSDDMPDIIEYGWAGYPGGPDKAIDDKFITPLNSYIEKVCPNLRALYDEHPDYAVQMVTDKGNYYQFPFIRGEEKLATYMTYIIREDLLSKAGLAVPETLDEWETALYAFKDQGIKAPINLRIKNSQLATFSPFTACYGFAGTFYHDENNKVKFGPYEKEKFTPWVEMLKKWYDDGILDREFANEDLKRINAMVTNGDNGAIFCAIGGEFGNFISAIPEGSPIHYVPTKIPVRNKGELAMYTQKDFPVMNCCAISYTSEHKELAARLLDFGYSEAGHIMYNFGKEGDSFNYKDGPRGSHIPTYEPKVVDQKENGNLSVAQGMSKYIRAYTSGPFVQDIEYIYQYYPTKEQTEALDLWESDTLKYKLPLLSMSIEEQQRYNDIMTPIDTYREETLAKIVSGKTPISELDAYYDQLKKLGIEDAIKLQQDAYDRYLKKEPVKFAK